MEDTVSNGKSANAIDVRRVDDAHVENTTQTSDLQFDERLQLVRIMAAQIKGFSELLESPRTGPLNPKQCEYLAEIEAGATGLVGLVDRMLSASSAEDSLARNPAPQVSVDPATGSRIHTLVDLEKGLALFRQIKIELEERHLGKFVTIDIDSGDYEIGASRLGAVHNFKAKYGDRHTFTYHVGTTS